MFFSSPWKPLPIPYNLYMRQVVFASLQQLKKDTCFQMLTLDFLQGFYLVTRLLAIIVDFHFSTQHHFSHVIEASH